MKRDFFFIVSLSFAVWWITFGLGILAGTKADYKTQVSGGPDQNLLLSPSTAQSGAPWICRGSSGASNPFACRMNPTQSTYPSFQFLVFVPDVDCGASNALDIDALGPVALIKSSGAPVGPGECSAGTPYLLLARGVPINGFIVVGIQ